MEAVAEQYDVIVSKIDIEETPNMSTKFDIQSVPTVVMIDKENEEVGRIIGAMPMAKVVSAFNLT